MVNRYPQSPADWRRPRQNQENLPPTPNTETAIRSGGPSLKPAGEIDTVIVDKTRDAKALDAYLTQHAVQAPDGWDGMDLAERKRWLAAQVRPDVPKAEGDQPPIMNVADPIAPNGIATPDMPTPPDNTAPANEAETTGATEGAVPPPAEEKPWSGFRKHDEFDVFLTENTGYTPAADWDKMTLAEKAEWLQKQDELRHGDADVEAPWTTFTRHDEFDQFLADGHFEQPEGWAEMKLDEKAEYLQAQAATRNLLG